MPLALVLESRFQDLKEESKTSSLLFLKNYAISITNWLGRSGLSSLSISLYSQHSVVPKEHYDIIIDSLLSFVNRWKDLVLDTYYSFLSPIAELMEFGVPRPESLTLHDIVMNSNPHYVLTV